MADLVGKKFGKEKVEITFLAQSNVFSRSKSYDFGIVVVG
jgi:hypothetical protein